MLGIQKTMLTTNPRKISIMPEIARTIFILSLKNYTLAP